MYALPPPCTNKLWHILSYGGAALSYRNRKTSEQISRSLSAIAELLVIRKWLLPAVNGHLVRPENVSIVANDYPPPGAVQLRTLDLMIALIVPEQVPERLTAHIRHAICHLSVTVQTVFHLIISRYISQMCLQELSWKSSIRLSITQQYTEAKRQNLLNK